MRAKSNRRHELGKKEGCDFRVYRASPRELATEEAEAMHREETG